MFGLSIIRTRTLKNMRDLIVEHVNTISNLSRDYNKKIDVLAAAAADQKTTLQYYKRRAEEFEAKGKEKDAQIERMSRTIKEQLEMIKAKYQARAAGV